MEIPNRRSILLDPRRWAFFGGRTSSANISNTVFSETLVVQGVSGKATDEEQAGAHSDGATTGGKGKSSSSAIPQTTDPSDETDSQSDSSLISAWADRLQVLTVVTTFLATMDGTIFSVISTSNNFSVQPSTISQELVFSALYGAMVFHICASILGYVASFVLIRYRIAEISSEEDSKPGSSSGDKQPRKQPGKYIVMECIHPFHTIVVFFQRLGGSLFKGDSSGTPTSLPITQLTKCYYTTQFLTALGFILGLVGLLAYAWTSLQMTVGVFSSACLGFSLAVGIWAVSV